MGTWGLDLSWCDEWVSWYDFEGNGRYYDLREWKGWDIADEVKGVVLYFPWQKGDFEGGERNTTFAFFLLCTIIVIIAN